MRVSSPILASAFLVALSAGALAQETPAPAAQEPMPHPVDCTFTAATICTAGASCQPSDSLGEVSLPARMLIHFEHRMIAMASDDGLPHVSSISAFAASGEGQILQGVEGGSGWTIHATTGDDDVTFVIASHHTVLNAFGTCKPAE
jgi:hypothetical protein